jgi:predicted amidohydrolase
MSTWKIAGVQMDCRLADKEFNLQMIRERLGVVAAAGAHLSVFPEAILSGYGFKSVEEAWAHAEPLPGPATEVLGADCRRLGVWVVFGLLERQGDRLYNACALVGPGGFQGRYRKAHLPFLGIDRYAAAGDTPFEVHDLGGLRIGINICYDAGFPEAARCLALAGADLILLPTNWPEGAASTPKYLVPARALENHVYYAAVNRVGTERGFRFIGNSLIVNVHGDTLTAAGSGEEIIYADIDAAIARAKRIVFIPGQYEVDRIAHRRPELYARLCDPPKD